MYGKLEASQVGVQGIVRFNVPLDTF